MARYCGDSDPVLFGQQMLNDIRLLMHQFKGFYGPIHGYLAGGICLFGLVTNFIHLLVLTHRRMRYNAVNCLLAAVAFCDCGTMLSYLIYITYFVILPDDICFIGRSYEWVVFAIGHVFTSIYLHSTSLWLVVALAFVRLMVLRERHLCSEWQGARRAAKLSILIFVLLLILCLPNLPLQKIQHTRINASQCGGESRVNDTVDYYFVQLSPAAVNHGCRMLKAHLLIIGALFKIVPCILLGILSFTLLRRVHQRAVIRRSLHRFQSLHKGHYRAPDRTTVMLISILLIFLITELPQGIIAFTSGVFTEDVYLYIYGGIADLLDLLSLINSSVNFVLYCYMSSQYRQTFRQLFLMNRKTMKPVKVPTASSMFNLHPTPRTGSVQSHILVAERPLQLATYSKSTNNIYLAP